MTLNIRKGLASSAKEHEVKNLLYDYEIKLMFLNEIDIAQEEAKSLKIGGFSTFLPSTKESNKVRSMLLVKNEMIECILIREDLQIVDIPIIFAEIKNEKRKKYYNNELVQRME